MFILYYIFKKLNLNKLSSVQKIFQTIKNNIIYRFFNRIITSIINYNRNEYTTLTSTKFGYFMYASLIMRSARFVGLILMLVMIYLPKLTDLWTEFYGPIYILQILSSSEAIVAYTAAGFFGWMVNLSYWVFLLSARLYYCNRLIRNSPIKMTNCVIYLVKTCTVAGIALGSGLIIPNIDSGFEKNGIVPPLKFLYAESVTNLTNGVVTPQMANEPSKNLMTFNGDEFPGASIVQNMQKRTLKAEENLHNAFIQQESKKNNF